MTLVEPGKSVYAEIDSVLDTESVMDASILVGYTWADELRSHASVITLGMDEEAVQAAARHRARAYWDARHDFGFGVPTGTVDECIQLARDAPESTVFLSDSGDNVTGGAVGDVPYVLESLLAHEGPRIVYASLVDAAAVEACFSAGLDAQVEVSLGGKLDPVHGRPLAVTGIVHTLLTPENGNRQGVLRIDDVEVILSERRMAFTTLTQFTELGIDPLEYKIACLKLGYLFPDFQRIAPKAIMAFSPGAIPALVETLPFERIERPMYPFDPDMQWMPEIGQ